MGDRNQNDSSVSLIQYLPIHSNYLDLINDDQDYVRFVTLHLRQPTFQIMQYQNNDSLMQIEVCCFLNLLVQLTFQRLQHWCFLNFLIHFLLRIARFQINFHSCFLNSLTLLQMHFLLLLSHKQQLEHHHHSSLMQVLFLHFLNVESQYLTHFQIELNHLYLQFSTLQNKQHG